MSSVPLFLDTTIQVDRVWQEIDPEAIDRLENWLAEYDLTLACAFSRLEYKRVVLQRLALDLRYLQEEQSFFGALARTSKNRGDRIPKSLVNALAWIGWKTREEVEVRAGDDADQQLRMRADTYIRNAILNLWYRFETSVDSVPNEMGCKRALEGPRRKRNGAIDVTVHEGSCRNRTCNCGGFFQSRLRLIRRLCSQLENVELNGGKLTPELTKALAMMNRALSNRSVLFDYQSCLAIGDVWIHLECVAAGVRDFATTNYKESELLCRILNLEMRSPA